MSRLVVAILLVGSVLTGCVLDGKKNEARISNQSGVAIEIFWTDPGEADPHYADMRPDQEIALVQWVNACAPTNMVAKTEEGLELARTQKPLCGGDFWVIGPLGSPAPS